MPVAALTAVTVAFNQLPICANASAASCGGNAVLYMHVQAKKVEI